MAVNKSRKGNMVDAKKPMVIHITKSDVRNGSLKDSSSCAAAKAICRQTACEAAKVYIGRTYIKQDGKWVRYATPPSLRNEIIAFDRGGQFEPGDYTLAPVQAVTQFKNRKSRAEYMKEYNARPSRAKKEDARKRKAGRRHIVKGIREQAKGKSFDESL